MNKSASGAKKYYCEQYYKEGGSTALDYYSEQATSIGRWGGQAAKMLGLNGNIAQADFSMLCDNINPVTGKTLTGRNDADRTVGYDFTFNASKSVSLAYALGTEEDKSTILTAFQYSVRETMEEIEAGMQARVRAKGQNENRLTGNLAYGEFTHFTTRPIDGMPDPHLHSHCFVVNATYDGQDQKWKAGQFRQVKQDAPYYEALFHAKLAQRLQHAGYSVERTKSGFELAGISKTTIEKFSRRTQEIEDYSREHGITDAEKKAQVGARTREAKRPPLTPEKQTTAWFSRLTAAELTALRHLKKERDNSPSLDTQGQAARESLQLSLQHHLERKSVASDKEILATAIKSGIGKTSAESVKHAFAHDERLLSADEGLRTYVTTKSALQEEKQLIRHCIAARNKFRPINEAYEPQNPLLNDQQKMAVRHALSTTDGITIITGKAGTGKTTLMKEVQQGILASGKRIFAFAPSSEASRGVQRSEGFDNAETVAKLIQDKNMHPELNQQVLWIDEAGMLSNKDMNHILAIAEEQSARVILSGDTRQHSSVERGDALRIIQQETGIKPVTVSKIQRQQQAEYKEAVQQLSDGNAERGFNMLDKMGAIHEIADHKERVDAIVTDYYQSAYAGQAAPVKNVLVVAPTHAEGDAVTHRIRQELKDHEVIGQQDRSYTVLKNRQFSEAEKQQPENYRQGDLLSFHQHSKGLRSGSRLEVQYADEKGISATDKGGIPHLVAFSEAKKFNVFEQKSLDIAEGDKLRITANGKSNEGKHLFNGTTHHIEQFDKEGNIKLSNGATLSADYGHFNLGYVSTSHAAQGKTADKVIVSQSSATFQASSKEQFYVSVSRGKQAVSIYTDDKEQLQQAVSQSAERTSATELMAKRQQQAQEINRLAAYRNMQEPTATIDKQQTATRTYDRLPAKARTEQDEGRQR